MSNFSKAAIISPCIFAFSASYKLQPTSYDIDVPRRRMHPRISGRYDISIRSSLETVKKLQADKQVYLRADQDVRYGLVMKTIAEIKQAGIEKLGMVTRPPASEG